jgi:hypothetical protein
VECIHTAWARLQRQDVWSAGHQGHGGSSSASYTAPRLTYPQEPDLAGLHAEESESDILPFAIDGDAGASLDVTSPSAEAQTGAVPVLI